MLKEIGILEDKSGEKNHDFEGKETQLSYWRSSLVKEEAIMTKKLESPSDVLTSSANNASYLNSSKVVDESCVSMDLQSSSFEPLSFATAMTELQAEESQDKTHSDSELPIIMDKSEHTASSDCVDNALTIVKEHAKEKIELGAIRSDVLNGESVQRQELYMFYEVNKSATGSMIPLSSSKSPSSHSSFIKKNELYSKMGDPTLKGPELLKEVSLEIAGNVITEYVLSSHFVDVIIEQKLIQYQHR